MKKNLKKQSRCTTKPLKIAATHPVSPFSRNNRKAKAELERETWNGSTLLTATASKPNIGKEFFRILSKHLPSYHMLRKICNKNCVKLSYRCNAQRCSHHLLAQQSAPQGKTIQSYPLACNCRDKSNCSPNGRCREKSLVYKTTIQRLNNRNV